MNSEFDNMSTRQLKGYAKNNNIDLGQAKSKEDILLLLNNTKKDGEDIKMDEEKVIGEVATEMEANGVVGTDVPAAEVSTEDKRVWHDAEGNEVSMSQFIREQFTKNNKSRKAIADEFKINYRTVYGATVNMENDAEPASRGRGVTNPKIQVTADNKVFTTVKQADESIKYFLNNEEITAEEATALETVETDRNTWIKERVAAGSNRGDIAKDLDLSYGVVYGLTKEEDGTRQKYEVEYTDEAGEKKTMARSEYIRKRVAEGVSKSDVAKELSVEYSVVWQATKKDKSDADKLAEAIESVAKFADKLDITADATAKETFLATIETLKAFKVVEEVVAEAPVAEVTPTV